MPDCHQFSNRNGQYRKPPICNQQSTIKSHVTHPLPQVVLTCCFTGAVNHESIQLLRTTFGWVVFVCLFCSKLLRYGQSESRLSPPSPCLWYSWQPLSNSPCFADRVPTEINATEAGLNRLSNRCFTRLCGLNGFGVW